MPELASKGWRGKGAREPPLRVNVQRPRPTPEAAGRSAGPGRGEGAAHTSCGGCSSFPTAPGHSYRDAGAVLGEPLGQRESRRLMENEANRPRGRRQRPRPLGRWPCGSGVPGSLRAERQRARPDPGRVPRLPVCVDDAPEAARSKAQERRLPRGVQAPPLGGRPRASVPPPARGARPAPGFVTAASTAVFLSQSSVSPPPLAQVNHLNNWGCLKCF